MELTILLIFGFGDGYNELNLVEIFLFSLLQYIAEDFDHVGWSKLLLLITPTNGQMCLLFVEKYVCVNMVVIQDHKGRPNSF